MNDIIKNLNIEKIRPFAIAAVCFAAVFMAGFGTGKLHNGVSNNGPTKRTLSNYTTNAEDAENKNTPKVLNKNLNTDTKAQANSSNSSTTGDCYIKGSKSKIYHMPGGSFYERTNAVQCFASEEEAQADGYTKSSR